MADRRDPRFGGNMEVANTGIPYPTGGRDVRFDGSLPPQFQYRDRGRTVVSGNEPAFTDMGRNWNVPFNVPFDDSQREQAIRNQYRTFNDSRREQAIMNQYQRQGAPGQHPNPRMRGRMRGMGGGLGSLQEQAAVDPSDWRTIIKILEAGGDPGTETQTAQIERNWDSMPDLADWKQGIGPGARKPIQTIPIFPGTFGDSLEGLINDQTLGNQWAEIAEADTGIGSTNEYQTAGLWQTWKKILERTGSEDLANQWLESQQAV